MKVHDFSYLPALLSVLGPKGVAKPRLKKTRILGYLLYENSARVKG